jgi:hypothetical protein
MDKSPFVQSNTNNNLKSSAADQKGINNSTNA